MKKEFEYLVEVDKSEIDFNRHVANHIYFKWMSDTALAHTDYCGFTMEGFIESGASFFAKTNTINYKKAVALGDIVVIQTWVEPASRASSLRKFIMTNKETGALIATAETLYAYVSFSTGRPILIPEHVKRGFGT